MSRPPRQKLEPHVLLAIQEIEDFHKLGTPLTNERAYGERRIANLADDLGINEDTLRKARAFADKLDGYSRQDLRELIKYLKTHQYRNPKWKFGRTHIIRLISVPKVQGQRDRLQGQVIDNEWTCSQLDNEIRRLYPARKSGGRHRRVPTDPDGLLTQVEHECDRWKRWCNSLRRESKGKIPADELPAEVQTKLGQIEKLVEKLHNAVNDARGTILAETR